jgi:DNA-binding transcriptional LysR family regulator
MPGPYVRLCHESNNYLAEQILSLRMADFSVAGLRMLREVARRGSLTAAAERLGYTQSSLSRQVAIMERAAGHPLLDRHARGVRVTEAGEIVLRRAEAVLAELEAAEQDLDDLRGRPPAGRLRVGAFSTALGALVPRALAAFSARRPRTRVELREGISPGLVKRAADGRVDVAIVTAADESRPTLEIIRLLDDPLLIAVDREHRLAGRASVSPDDLRGERWISAGKDSRSPLLGAWTASSWTPDIAYFARDWTAKLGLAAAGLGITIVPGLAVPILPPTLALVRIDHPAATRTTAMVTRSDAPDDPDRHALSEALRDSAAEIAAHVRQQLRA